MRTWVNDGRDLGPCRRRLNRERGLTFVIVTHDIAVGRRADRIVRSTAAWSARNDWRTAMHARVTLLEIDTMRATVPAAVALFEREVLPELQAQDGYRGAVVLAT